MCVDWIAYILLYVNWIDIESECWWIICYCWDMLNWKWKCIMWLLCEWLLRSDEMKSEYVELFEFGWLVDNWLICVCCWEWCDCEICWVEKWDEDEILRYVDDERMIWAIEIVDLKCVELDWIDELCELFVFDGNELVV